MNNVHSVLQGFDAEIEKLGVGSSEFQIANFTYRIKKLTEHLATNKKDFSCKYGLVKLVSKRAKMLKYIKSQDTGRYKAIISHLGLRK